MSGSRDFCAFEYKATRRNLAEALKQLMTYALALDHPPLLVVCDTSIIEIHTTSPNAPSEVHTIALEDISQPAIITKPLDTSFLHRQTRDSILKLGAQLGYRINERNFTVSELIEWVSTYEATLSGTAACLSSVGTLVYQGREIAVVASVAGYGGLPNALIYGATKAALINFSETLYLDLSSHAINVTLINPGFVATRLTAHNKFAMPALLTSEQAAQKIIAGFARGDFEIHFPKRFTSGSSCSNCCPIVRIFI